MCGGTAGPAHTAGNAAGLSPRVRGNPYLAVVDRKMVGSIPACAGEPPSQGAVQPLPEVYPRVCGGTRAAPD